MRAFLIPQGSTSIAQLRAMELREPRPRPYQVVVRIHATSLNRRDQAVASGIYFGRPVGRDTIPLSDGAGEVHAVGEGVTRWRTGDRVVALFHQTPPLGSPFATAEAMGSPLDGVLAEYVVLYEDGLVAIPESLSFEQAACLPCAALTAWNALMVAGKPVTAGDSVLVLGTGGVAMFAMQFANAVGARVIATSSSDAKLARAMELGASAGVNYIRTPEWHKRVQELTDGRGVDCVVEVGGVETLERSFESVAVGGKVALVGVLTGRRAAINPYALIWKEATLHGIRVGTGAMFAQMMRAIEANRIIPIVDKTFQFEDAVAAYDHLASGNFVGKIVVKV